MVALSSSIATRLSATLVSMDRTNKVAMMLGADLLCLPICSFIALVLRMGEVQLSTQYGFAPHLLISFLTVPVFYMAGLYSAVIRYIDHRLLATSGIALALVAIITYGTVMFLDHRGPPKGVLAIYWFIAFSYVVASRLAARRLLRFGNAGTRRDKERRVAIYGAGEAGAKLANAMRAGYEYRAACFFDDKLTLNDRSVAGLKVFHSESLMSISEQLRIDLIVIAIPSATPEQRRKVMARTQKGGVPVKILCSLVELANEEISTRSIRELNVNDLLGREPIRPKPDLFAKCVRGKNVLVTGGGGSIGSELCRQIMTQAPRQLHLLDHSEYALYSIEQELKARYGGKAIHTHLGSVCNSRMVERLLKECQIDTIYHAAAYKHVPLVECNIAEGIRNNVEGADVIAFLAGKCGAKTCVLVSTDKAVHPTSCMGASKRIAELIFQAAAVTAPETKFCSVRFGNVLGSSGSVVPLFKGQIERGGPITITHPDVERYFMSIPEAAQLVMQAGAMATGGDVFVMDMGHPVKIVDLARTMIAMSGLREKDNRNADGDIEIRFIGLRPGEKLYEELFVGNDAVPSKHPRIKTTTEYVIDPETLAKQVAYLMLACATNDTAMIKLFLKRLVKGYVPSTSENDPVREIEDAQDQPHPPLHGHKSLANSLGAVIDSGRRNGQGMDRSNLTCGERPFY